MRDRFRAFYESLGERYPEDYLVYRTLSGLIRKKWILKKLQTLPKGNLLDCGCNIGTLSKNWRRGDIFGVDLSYSVLKRGKDNAPRTVFIQADLRDLSMFKPESFHNAMACEVVEHLDQPGAFFEHLYHAIRKGGHVLITTPNFSHRRPDYVGLGILRSFGVTTGTSDENYLHTAYHPDELAKMAQAAGFTVIERGSFEHELRGWLKPLTVIQETFNTLSRKFFPSSRLIQLFQGSIKRIEINAFAVMDTLSLPQVLKRIFRQGRRSYIVATK